MKILNKKFYEDLGKATANTIRADNRKRKALDDLRFAEELKLQAAKDLVQADLDFDRAKKEQYKIAKYGDKL